jgi:hypothetical protein
MAQIQVVDVIGRVVYSKRTSNLTNERIDVSELATGAYQVLVSDGNITSKLNVIIE